MQFAQYSRVCVVQCSSDVSPAEFPSQSCVRKHSLPPSPTVTFSLGATLSSFSKSFRHWGKSRGDYGITRIIASPPRHRNQRFDANSARLLFHSAGPSRCLDAFLVALNQAPDTDEWYTTTVQLQLASPEFCAACRSVPTLHLRVDKHTPTRLRSDGDASSSTEEGESAGNGVVARVPVIRARKVTWDLRRYPARCKGVAV